MTSDAFLLAIAIQRYTMICRPLGKQMTLFWRRVTISFVIVANSVYSIPVTVVSGVQDKQIVYKNVTMFGKRCSLGNEKFPTLQLISVGIVIFIIVANIVVTSAMYTPIACVIYRRLRRREAPSFTSPCDNDNAGSSGKAASQTEDTCVSTSQNSIAPSIITKETDREEKPKNKYKTDKRSKHNFNIMFFVIVFVYVVTSAMTALRHTVLHHDDATSSDNAIRFLYISYEGVCIQPCCQSIYLRLF